MLADTRDAVADSDDSGTTEATKTGDEFRPGYHSVSARVP